MPRSQPALKILPSPPPRSIAIPPSIRTIGPALSLLLATGFLVSCATPPQGADTNALHPTDAALQNSAWAARSRVIGLPGSRHWTHKAFGDRRPTRYRPTTKAGRDALHAHSAAGNSTVRLALTPAEGTPPVRLGFSWYVPALIEQADLKDRAVDDAVARVILTFGGDRDQRFSSRDHMLSELARIVTGEPLPYATLMYVWDNRYPVGTVIPNPHSSRIRQLVVESGPDRLDQWVDFERDVQTDFQRAFGEAPGPLHSVGIMTDSNNTGTTTQAWYGPVTLRHAGDKGAPPMTTPIEGQPVSEAWLRQP
ncbi:MAG: DUF3047 domain-containing protein [Burkholderiaceae bacterium]